MRGKVIRIILIITTTLLPIILNSFFIRNHTYEFLWSLLLIPEIITLVSFPSWSISIGVALSLSALKYLTEYLHGHFSKEDLVRLTISSLVNWFIFITAAYYTIKYEKALQEVRELSFIDPLTGINNRRYFDLYMEKAIPYSLKTGRKFVMATLDIDHFKKINDTYGHLCGDKILKHTATIIKESIRESDTIVRIGGEEFIVVLPELTVEEGKQIANRIRERIEISEFYYKGRKVPVTISIGLVQYTDGPIEKLMEKADRALYEAKQKGRNRVVVASNS